MPHGFRKVLIAAVLPVWVLGSCSKELEPIVPSEYTCSYSISYENEAIAFKGYSPTELSKVILQKFKVGSNYSVLIGTDTLDASGAVFRGDTAYLSVDNFSYRGFFSLRDSVDYKVDIPNANKEYTISLKRGDASKTWTQRSPCSPGASEMRYNSFSVLLNGRNYYPYVTMPHRYFICLQR